MNSKGYFITGTDTGVGKTVVSAIVAKKLNFLLQTNTMWIK